MLLAAVGIDGNGEKHPLGVIEGATENTAVVQALLDNLVGRGLEAAVCRLFIIDGAKALSKAIRNTFGRHTPIQRCQVHKDRKDHRAPEPSPGACQSVRHCEAAARIACRNWTTPDQGRAAAIQETWQTGAWNMTRPASAASIKWRAVTTRWGQQVTRLGPAGLESAPYRIRLHQHASKNMNW